MLSFTVYYIVQRDEVGTLEDSRGHSFLKELRLICSFHHLGNDMAIKAYTIKCQNYHKKRSDMPNEILMLIYVSVRLVEASILSFWKFEHFYVTVELWNI